MLCFFLGCLWIWRWLGILVYTGLDAASIQRAFGFYSTVAGRVVDFLWYWLFKHKGNTHTAQHYKIFVGSKRQKPIHPGNQETAPAYNSNSKRRILCLEEKMAIITFPEQQKLLNKRSELISKYRHENKFLLQYYDSKDKKTFLPISYLIES